MRHEMDYREEYRAHFGLLVDLSPMSFGESLGYCYLQPFLVVPTALIYIYDPPLSHQYQAKALSHGLLLFHPQYFSRA